MFPISQNYYYKMPHSERYNVTHQKLPRAKLAVHKLASPASTTRIIRTS